MKNVNPIVTTTNSLLNHITVLSEMKGMTKTTKRAYSKLIKNMDVKRILKSSIPISRTISDRCNSNGLDTKSIVSSSRGGVEGNHNTIELPNENKRYYTLTTKT